MFNFIKSVLIKNKKRDILLPQNEIVNTGAKSETKIDSGYEIVAKKIKGTNYFHHTQTIIECISDHNELQTIYGNKSCDHNTVYQRILAYIYNCHLSNIFFAITN